MGHGNGVNDAEMSIENALIFWRNKKI